MAMNDERALLAPLDIGALKYISEEISALHTLSIDANEPFLTYLLDMARMESLAACTRAKRVKERRMHGAVSKRSTF